MYSSTSVEHIVPESLGNKRIYLPKGYVCDACNHYFAIKIEKDLLNQPYFISLRSRNEILSKKNRLVKQDMIFPGAQKKAGVSFQTYYPRSGPSTFPTKKRAKALFFNFRRLTFHDTPSSVHPLESRASARHKYRGTTRILRCDNVLRANRLSKKHPQSVC